MSYDGGRLTPIQLMLLTGGLLFGTTTFMIRPGPAQQEAWLTQAIACLLGFLYMLLYLALLGKFPGKTIVEIAQILLGKAGRVILGLLFFWYFLHLSALNLRAFIELLVSVYMPETPIVAFTVAMLCLSAVSVRSGIETIARSAELSLAGGLVLLFPFLTTTLAMVNGLFNPSRLLPVFDHSLSAMALSTFSQTAFPFGELVVITMTAGLVNKFTQGRRAILWGCVYGAALALTAMVRPLAMLGAEDVSHLVYPTLPVIKLIHLGSFFTRVEALELVTLTITVSIKLALSHYAATVALGQSLGLRNYRSLTLPVSGLIGGLSLLLVDNVLELIEFLAYYALYAFPFQLLFPLLLLVLSRSRAKSVSAAPVPEGGQT